MGTCIKPLSARDCYRIALLFLVHSLPIADIARTLGHCERQVEQVLVRKGFVSGPQGEPSPTQQAG